MNACETEIDVFFWENLFLHIIVSCQSSHFNTVNIIKDHAYLGTEQQA